MEPDLSRLKQSIEQSWAADISWSDRTAARNYGETPDFIRLTGMVRKIAKRYTRVVEIGCGDAKYLAYLRGLEPGIPDWIATDISGPRIERARREVTEVRVEAADILECQARYNEAGTLFVAANVFGNIAPDDIATFFSRMTKPGTGLAFLAGGLSLELDEPFVLRPNGIAFDHNFFALLKRSRLTELEYVVDYFGGRTKTAGYWITGHVAN